MNARPLQAAAALAACALAGCAVGPDYGGPPATPLPAKYKGADKGAGSKWSVAEPRDQAAKGPWWEIFRDPALNRLETQALAANQDLKVALSRIEQSRAQTRIAAADFFPRADFAPSGVRQRTTNTAAAQKAGLIGGLPGAGGGAGAAGPADGAVLQSQPLTNTFNDFRAPAQLNWELDLFGRVRRTYEAERAQAAAAEADFHSMTLSVTASVAAGYFNLRALDTEMDVLDRTIRTRQEALRIAGERLEAGLTGELDVARAQADLASNEADRFGVQRARGEAENALATLLGQTASGCKIARRPLEARPPRVPAGLPSRLLERRPDVAAAERLVAAANARVGIATAAFFPVVRLTGAAGFESADLGSLFAWESRLWSLGPSVQLPIFEGGRNAARLRQTRAQHEEQVGRYRQQVLVAFQEVENALVDLRTLAGQAQAQERAGAAARRALELSTDQYIKGASNFLDVIDAERSVLQSERASTLLNGQRMQASVQLIKALGGGWGAN